MVEQLITLKHLAQNGLTDVNFGTSPVEYRQLGEGSIHKAARKEARRLLDLYCPIFNFDVGQNYIYHTQTGIVFVETVFPDGNNFYIGSRSTNGIYLDSSKPSHFVGGMCIGGSATLLGVDEDNNQHNLLEREMPGKLQRSIFDIKCDPRISVYEADTILKLTSAVKALAHSVNSGQPNHLTFHLPIPEYLLYVLQYYQNGVLNETQAFELAEIIKKRGMGLTDMAKKRFSNIKGLENISVGSPLDKIIPDDILLLGTASPDEVVSTLASGDPLWKIIASFNQPKTWTELADCSYQSLYLRLGQAAEGRYNLVGVENPEEISILLAAKKTAFNASMAFSMACLYPHSHVFTTTGTPRRLYRHQTTAPFEDLKIVYNQY